MRHDIHAEGSAFRLRPVKLEDAGFIVALRTDEGRNRFIHETSSRLQDQERWLQEYFTRDGDYYFAVETRAGEPEGLISIYNCDERQGEWGRWILRSGSLAAVESAMLIYDVGFERLKLEEVYCRTSAFNRTVLSFHDSMEIPRVAVHENLFALAGGLADAIEHRLTRKRWAELKEALRSKADRLAAKVKRG